MVTICNIHRQWKIFGDYWHLNNMRRLLAAKNRRGSKADKEDVVIDIFRRVAEADENIRNTDAYHRWVKSVQNQFRSRYGFRQPIGTTNTPSLRV